MDIEKFKQVFNESFDKVTPNEFIQRMENLGYKFQENKAVEVSDEEINDLVNKINTDWSGNYRAVFIRGMKFMRDKQGIAPCKDKLKEFELSAQELHDKHGYFQGDNWTVLKRLFNEFKEGEGK